jgi:pectinesterase
MMKSAVIITILLLSSFVASAEKVYTVDCNGGGDFRTIQACFDALPSKPAEWRTVRIMPGVYREKVTLDVYKDKVRILGDEMAETRIVWGDYAGKVVDGRELTTYDSYTMSVQADDVYLDCLTVENDAGRVGQAVALETRGDRIHLYHCAIRTPSLLAATFRAYMSRIVISREPPTSFSALRSCCSSVRRSIARPTVSSRPLRPPSATNTDSSSPAAV